MTVGDGLLIAFPLLLITFKAPNWPFHLLLAFFDGLIWVGGWAKDAKEGAVTGYNIYRLRRANQRGIKITVLPRQQDVRVNGGVVAQHESKSN